MPAPFDIGGDRRCSERGTGDGSDCIGEQRFPRARQRAVAHQPRLLPHSDERADGIEEREEEENKHDRQHAWSERSPDIELHEGGCQRGRTARESFNVNDTEQGPHRGRSQYSPKERAGDPSRHQDRGERHRHNRDDRRRRMEVTERHECAGRRHDEPAPLESNRGDEEADAGRDRVLQGRGNRRDQALAQAYARRDREQHPCEGHAAKRNAPRHFHPDDDRVGKEEVVPHRGCDRNRIVREQRHQRRREGRRQARCGQHSAEIHAGRAQNGRLDKNNVRHCKERGDARQDLSSDGRTVR
jgi:hypothetical protein